ncbi:hypothetical protein OUZ56_001526 [Daphnia magna]|uniref:Uncharacterized protein n=1 Tax=Daphnia magna TaxID=35525 RepID=A0ABR0A3H7_9CRUS|nr:hypothetical protein OUZ56_001526 [Daphnia magna]
MDKLGRPTPAAVRVEVFVEKLDLRHKVQMAKKSDTNVSDKSLERVGKNGGIKFRPTTYDRPGLNNSRRRLMAVRRWTNGIRVDEAAVSDGTAAATLWLDSIWMTIIFEVNGRHSSLQALPFVRVKISSKHYRSRDLTRERIISAT